MPECNSCEIPPDCSSSEFRCCCNAMHVKRGTLVIGIIESISALLCCVTLCAINIDIIRRGVLEMLLFITTAVLISLFFGLRKKESQLLVPYLIYRAIWILVYSVLMVFSFFSMLDSENTTGSLFLKQILKIFDFSVKENEITELSFKFVETMTLLFLASISLWCFSVVYRCHKYFNEVVEFQEDDVDTKYSVSLD